MAKPAQITGDMSVEGEEGEAAELVLGGATQQPIIAQIDCGYSATEEAPNGLLTIANGATVLRRIPITAAGAAPIHFKPPIYGAYGQALTITLSAHAGAKGYLNVTRVA